MNHCQRGERENGDVRGKVGNRCYCGGKTRPEANVRERVKNAV